MKKPLITIITVSFNSEKTIEETILSVITQSYDNYEYIIVDGGSSDSTLKIIEKYASKITKSISEPDKGISDAFNKGISLASGDVIGIINSDDLLIDNALEIVANAYEENVEVYRGQMVIWDDQKDAKYISIPTMSTPPPKRIPAVCHPSTFISSNAYRRFGMYNVNFRYMMDVDLLYRFHNHHAVFKYIDKELAVFRVGGATSDNWKKKRPELMCVLEANGCNKRQILLRLFMDDIYNMLKQLCFKIFGERNVRLIKYNRK